MKRRWQMERIEGITYRYNNIQSKAAVINSKEGFSKKSTSSNQCQSIAYIGNDQSNRISDSLSTLSLSLSQQLVVHYERKQWMRLTATVNREVTAKSLPRDIASPYSHHYFTISVRSRETASAMWNPMELSEFSRISWKRPNDRSELRARQEFTPESGGRESKPVAHSG